MRRAFTWNVRNRFLVAFLIVAVVPLVVFGALVYSQTSSALRDVERQQIVAQARGAREILRVKTRDESEFIRDYSVWDGFHNALSARNLAWVRSNVTEWVPTHSTTNLVRVFDSAGKSLASGGDTVSADLWAKNEVQAARRGVVSSDLEDLGGRLYVLTAAPVVAQARPSRPAGIVVFG